MRMLQDDNTSLRGHVETRNTEILRLRAIIQDMHGAEQSPQGLQMANSRRSSEGGGPLEVSAAAMPNLDSLTLYEWSALESTEQHTGVLLRAPMRRRSSMYSAASACVLASPETVLG